MTVINLRPDIRSALSTLVDVLQNNKASVDRFLQQMEARQIVNPFQNRGELRPGEPLPDEFWAMNSIYRIVVDCVQSGSTAVALPALLCRSKVIEFANWADKSNSSAMWQNLYSQVIKTLDKRNFRFIFHLGDPSHKHFFEVDEVLDIMGDYVTHGHVTLILHRQQADDLWCQLNGWDKKAFVRGIGTPSGRERYLSIFNTTRFSALIVLDSGLAFHLSSDGQFQLEKIPPMRLYQVMYHGGGFGAGYQLGFLLQLDAVHCTALGLAVSGGCSAPYPDGTSRVIDFIQDWLKFLS
ncbi:MAG TPA: hypothetical protein VG890_03230 [Puia sp.]|nr:hypothetical protein [Puia sp.]